MSPSVPEATIRSLGAVAATAAFGSGVLALVFERQWPDPLAVQLADTGTLVLGVAMLAVVALHLVSRAAGGALVVAVRLAAAISATGMIVAVILHLASGRVDDYSLVDIATIAGIAALAALALLTWRSRRWAPVPRLAMLLVPLAIAVALPVALLTAINVGRDIATTAMALGYGLVGLAALVRPALLTQEWPTTGEQVGASAGLLPMGATRG